MDERDHSPGHRAVVTETGLAASVAEPTGYIWATKAGSLTGNRLLTWVEVLAAYSRYALPGISLRRSAASPLKLDSRFPGSSLPADVLRYDHPEDNHLRG